MMQPSSPLNINEKELLEKIMKTNLFKDEPFKIYYKNVYNAFDTLTKTLRELFPNQKSKMIPMHSVGKDQWPIYFLYPSNDFKFNGINSYNSIRRMGVGLLCYTPESFEGILRALTSVGGNQRVPHVITLIKLENYQEIFSPAYTKNISPDYEANENIETGGFISTSRCDKVFSTDRTVYTFHPTLQSMDEICSEFENILTTEKNKSLKNAIVGGIGYIKTLRKYLDTLGECVTYELKALNSLIKWDNSFEDNEINDILKIAFDEANDIGSRASGTYEALLEDMKNLRKTKQTIKNRKLELDRNIELFQKECHGDETAKLAAILHKMKLVNRLELKNDTKVEADFKVVARFEFIHCDDAKLTVQPLKMVRDENDKEDLQSDQ